MCSCNRSVKRLLYSLPGCNKAERVEVERGEQVSGAGMNKDTAAARAPEGLVDPGRSETGSRLGGAANEECAGAWVESLAPWLCGSRNDASLQLNRGTSARCGPFGLEFLSRQAVHARQAGSGATRRRRRGAPCGAVLTNSRLC